VVAAVGDYRATIDDFFASMPATQWARTLPIGIVRRGCLRVAKLGAGILRADTPRGEGSG
jgi:hypothetical protein